MKRILLVLTMSLLLAMPACNTVQQSGAAMQPPETGLSGRSESSEGKIHGIPDSLETSAPVPAGSIQTDKSFNEDGSVKTDVYVNDELMDVKVFEDYVSSCPGQSDLTSYVQAEPIFDLLGIEYSIGKQKNLIRLTSEKYGKNDFFCRLDEKITGGQAYIKLSDLKTYTDGWLGQAGFSLVYLYTGDKADSGDRLKFLPATLEECYTALDAILSPARIKFFKNARHGDIINEHFGLGLWIRNNWIRPDGSKLTSFFIEHGENVPDGMSGIVMEGYVKYLNGQPCSHEDLLG